MIFGTNGNMDKGSSPGSDFGNSIFISEDMKQSGDIIPQAEKVENPSSFCARVLSCFRCNGAAAEEIARRDGSLRIPRSLCASMGESRIAISTPTVRLLAMNQPSKFEYVRKRR